MRYTILASLFSFLILMACQSEQGPLAPIKDKSLERGAWRGLLRLNDSLELPFELAYDGQSWEIINGEERILLQVDSLGPDSMRWTLPVFGTYFNIKQLNRHQLRGEWVNSQKEDYRLPFRAEGGQAFRFGPKTAAQSSLAKKWAVQFSPQDSANSYPGVALFELDPQTSILKGSFMTETGDYRYLAGEFKEERLQLSAFDGAHAFLFTAQRQGDGSLWGQFYSGKHWSTYWRAQPNPKAHLRPMDSLSFLKEGYEKISFSFPNSQGDSLSLEDERFKGKVVIVQIMGSWCPNCMDESRLLEEYYRRYRKEGLEIIALSYELPKDMDNFKKIEKRLRTDLGISYPMVLAGPADKKAAAKSLPMLNHILSFPTAIIIDRRGKVQKIHTGFNGPGTGDYYEVYREELAQLIEQLLVEQ